VGLAGEERSIKSVCSTVRRYRKTPSVVARRVSRSTSPNVPEVEELSERLHGQILGPYA